RLDGAEHGISFVGGAVDSANGALYGAVAVVDLFQGVGNLAHTGPGPGRIDGKCQQVAVTGFGGGGEGVQGGLTGGLVAAVANLLETGNLGGAHRAVVDIQDVDVRLYGELVFVDPDDDLLLAVDAGLTLGGGLLDAQLGHPRFHRLGHAAQGFDLIDDLARLLHQLVGEGLDVVGAGQGIHALGAAG